jgi:hypothetical protein
VLIGDGQVSTTQLELMHQRNPDVVFDFVHKEEGRDGTYFCLFVTFRVF